MRKLTTGVGMRKYGCMGGRWKRDGSLELAWDLGEMPLKLEASCSGICSNVTPAVTVTTENLSSLVNGNAVRNRNTPPHHEETVKRHKNCTSLRPAMHPS